MVGSDLDLDIDRIWPRDPAKPVIAPPPPPIHVKRLPLWRRLLGKLTRLFGRGHVRPWWF